jgi:hypothetical protein
MYLFIYLLTYLFGRIINLLLFQSYEFIRLGIQVKAVRFSLDGVRLEPDQTPKMMELEDGDQIDARIEQQGGGEGDETDNITIGVRGAHDELTNFKVKKTAKFEKIFQAYAERFVGSCQLWNIAVFSLLFLKFIF